MNDEIETEVEEVEEAPSLRDTLEDAYRETEEPTHEEGADAAEPVPVAEAEEGRARDGKGRFAQKDGEAVRPESAADAQAPARRDEPGGETQPTLDRAPQSWKPAAREEWAKVPPAVRAEVYRREQDVQQAFQQTAQERKLAQAFEQVYKPYEAMIRGEGSDPIRAFDHLLQTSYQLRTAQPVQKAQLVAGLIKQFNVDVQTLDSCLVGQMVPQQQQQRPQAPQDPRMDNLMQALQNIQRETTQKKAQSAQQEVAQFGQKHEFLDDVRDVMADLIEVSANRGVELSMEGAYNQACMLTPEIKQVMEQREKARVAAASQQRAGRSRRAASSVAGSPAGAPPSDGKPLTRRDALVQAMEDATG